MSNGTAMTTPAAITTTTTTTILALDLAQVQERRLPLRHRHGRARVRDHRDDAAGRADFNGGRRRVHGPDQGGDVLGLDDVASLADLQDGIDHRVADQPRRVGSDVLVDVADIARMAASPVYQSVIAMGDHAVRPILLRLRTEAEHWFYALHMITGEDPVPPSKRGRIKEMAAAWIAWGRERGYFGDMD